MKPKQFAALLGAISTLAGAPLCLANPVAGATGASSAAPASPAVGNNNANKNNNAATGTSPVAPGTANGAAVNNNPNSAVNPAASAAPGAIGTAPLSPNVPMQPGNGNLSPFLPGVTPIVPGSVVATGAGGTTGPAINGTVYGMGGKVYYVASDGLLYFRGQDGTFQSFGRFLPPTSPTAASQGSIGATGPLTTTPSGLTGATNVTGTANINSLTLRPPNGTAGPYEPGVYAPGSPTASSTAIAPGALPPGTTAGAPGSSPVSASGSQVAITGTAVGTDGRTFYLAADGFLYFRGNDGALHIFGSGSAK